MFLESEGTTNLILMNKIIQTAPQTLVLVSNKHVYMTTRFCLNVYCGLFLFLIASYEEE